MPDQNVNPTLSLSPNCVSKLFNIGYITNLTSHIHTCRFHSWAGGFESRLPSVDFYNMGSVEHFRKHPQTTEYINCQEYRQQATKAGADCYALQGTCNQLNFIMTLQDQLQHTKYYQRLHYTHNSNIRNEYQQL